MTSLTDIRRRWLEQLFSTDPADTNRAREGVRQLYAAAGFGEPRHVLWFDSPHAAAWAVALLIDPRHHLAPRLTNLQGDESQGLERARASMLEQLGASSVEQAIAAVGQPIGEALQRTPDPSRMFKMKILDAAFTLSDDLAGILARMTEQDLLSVAEDRFWGGNLGVLASSVACSATERLLANSFANEYSFSTMARHEELVGRGPVPQILRSAWETARSAGMWWPLERGAIMSERPAEIHLNDQKLLHRTDGPAVVFRDSSKVYAWNGKAVFERWIMQPEAVPPREYRGFDPTFVAFMSAKLKSSAAAPKKQTKVSAIVQAVLPPDHSARLDRLKAHAGGRLPLFDRYVAGEQRQVWGELMALGADVRCDPYAADALAVAHETMRRVGLNIGTLVQRLRGLNYAFAATNVAEFGGPPEGIAKAIAKFEKVFGPLPLSLRAFYENVGEVDLLGRHPTLRPQNGSTAPDPLVVYGFTDEILEYDDDEERPSAITIAPDDLHKENVSGSDPYEVAVPDPRADGELLNERHGLLFVDYLRLCFQFGGFPGYEGRHMPAEISSLRSGLLEF